jgi:hypothetical protein
MANSSVMTSNGIGKMSDRVAITSLHRYLREADFAYSHCKLDGEHVSAHSMKVD